MTQISPKALANSYRPKTFQDLIGQDALVKTLTNGIKNNRIAHAYLLTGIRGIGKTTTARIIARALNCENGPTTTPCMTCPQCKAIDEERHLDIIEIDAASRTGVDDIREIIDSVQYRPVQGKYKIYIIDEVHMLSTSAFNALLKTLEEPPQHVIFIFATTELRKIPATVISRCQRFDLKRIPEEILANHYIKIAEKENIKIEKDAAMIIARTADGSVRDGLSLLDQAISRSENSEIKEDEVRELLGLTERNRILDIIDTTLRADAKSTIQCLQNLTKEGLDPSVVLKDLLEIVHELTFIALEPKSIDPALTEEESKRLLNITKAIGPAKLQMAWQILLKSVEEVQTSPNARFALEMAILRLNSFNK